MNRSARVALVVPLAAVAVLAAAGCSAAPSPSEPAVSVAGSGSAGASWVEPGNGAAVDVSTFANALARSGVTLLDVRTPAEFASGHLDGARNVDVNSADFAATLSGLSTEGTYAVYCRSGNRSGTAVTQMVDQGFTRVFHLAGGITAWQAAGHPVAR